MFKGSVKDSQIVGTIGEGGEPDDHRRGNTETFVTAVYQMGRVFRYTATIMRP